MCVSCDRADRNTSSFAASSSMAIRPLNVTIEKSIPEMEKLALTLLMTGLVVQVPAVGAPVKANSFEAAQAVLQDDGYTLFAFAEDWDDNSVKISRKLMNSTSVKQAAGNAVFMEVPAPNVLTDAHKEADRMKFGELTIPEAPDYPAILMLTKGGRHCATICGPIMRKAKPQEVAKIIENDMTAMHKQEELLARAVKAQGVKKAKLLGKASRLPGINPPDALERIIGQIKKLDPENKTGYSRKLITPFDLSMEIFAIETGKDAGQGWQAALAQAETYLKDSVYSDVSASCVAFSAPAPPRKSANTAKAVERDWLLGFNYVEGWPPNVVSGSSKPIELMRPLPISSPGVYKVTFSYTRGGNAANIRAVSLYDGSKLAARDVHEGSAGIIARNNVYTLTVDQTPKEPYLFIRFDQSRDCASSGHSDFYGEITITH